SPLKDAGMGKADVRRLSKHYNLSTADLPAAACLASRIPYGMPVTEELLQRIARGEAAIRSLGFRRFRLRHQGDVARLEFDPGEMEHAFRFRRALDRRIQAEGWTYVALDLHGYAQGSLNRTLKKQGKKKR
ncbi:MAG: TIGR00268 family protein, partial [Planctomycetota bacterium]